MNDDPSGISEKNGHGCSQPIRIALDGTSSVWLIL